MPTARRSAIHPTVIVVSARQRAAKTTFTESPLGRVLRSASCHLPLSRATTPRLLALTLLHVNFSTCPRQYCHYFLKMSLAVLEKIYRLPGPEQVRHLNAGVYAGVFGDLAACVDVTVNTLATALGLSPRTLRNRAKKPARLTADETERGFRVYRVWRRASDVLGDKEAAASWINSPQKALGDQTPLSLLVRDVGTEEVLNVLTAIRYGVYL